MAGAGGANLCESTGMKRRGSGGRWSAKSCWCQPHRAPGPTNCLATLALDGCQVRCESTVEDVERLLALLRTSAPARTGAHPAGALVHPPRDRFARRARPCRVIRDPAKYDKLPLPRLLRGELAILGNAHLVLLDGRFHFWTDGARSGVTGKSYPPVTADARDPRWSTQRAVETSAFVARYTSRRGRRRIVSVPEQIQALGE
jgi:hypothetical protein